MVYHSVSFIRDTVKLIWEDASLISCLVKCSYFDLLFLIKVSHISDITYTYCVYVVSLLCTAAELPDEVYLVYDGEKLGSRDDIRPRDPGPIEVNCEVVGGSPTPEIRLYTGDIPG